MHTYQELRVGMTYDLKSDYLVRGYSEEESAEFDSEDTIDAIENVLTRMGFQVDRIGNIHALVERLAEGCRWDLVFNICEGMGGSAREAQVPCLLDAYKIPYVFSEAAVLSLALNKSMTKEMIRANGIHTAPSFLIHDLNRLDERALQFPLFLKPSMEGSSKGIHSDCKVSTPAEFYQTARRILRETSGPILAETYLPGPEFTVGLMGEGEHARVLGVMEVVFKNNGLPPIYCYETKLAYLDCIEYRMADQGLGSRIGEAALGAWRALGCRDGGRVDLRLDEQGVPHFIEVNPLPGLHPKSSDLVILARMSGYSYFELVSGIVEQALPRLAKTRHAEDAFTQSSFEFVCGLM